MAVGHRCYRFTRHKEAGLAHTAGGKLPRDWDSELSVPRTPTACSVFASRGISFLTSRLSIWSD